MVMDYLKLIIGMVLMRALSMPFFRGSNVMVTTSVVSMQGCSASATAMVMVAAVAGSVLFFRSLERKRLTLNKVILNNDE